MNTPYQIDADMLGFEFRGTDRDLQTFIEYLAEETGRGRHEFEVRTSADPMKGEAPTEGEWLYALGDFAEDYPELFEPQKETT